MKRLVVTLITLFVFTLSVFCASATTQEEEMQSAYEEFDVQDVEDATPEEVLNIFKEFEITPERPLGEEDIGIFDVFGSYINVLISEYTQPFRSLGFLTIVMMLSFVTSNLLKDKGWAQDVCDMIVLSSCAMMIIDPMSDLFGQVSESLSACTVFLNAFIPVFAGLLVASGFAAVSGTYSVVMIAYSDVFAAINSGVFLPCCHMLLASTVCTTLAKVPFSLANGVKKMIITVLSVLTTVLTGIIGLQTRLSSIGDNIAVKAAKSALGSFVPVVGGAWGDSLSVILGSIDLVRSSVGIYAVLTISMIFLPPLVKLLMWQLVLCVSRSLFEVAQRKAVVDLLNSISGLLTILVVVLLCSLLLIVISSLTVLSLGNSL